MATSIYTTVMCAAFGGVALPLIELSNLPNRPKAEHPDFKSIIYYLALGIQSFVGGVIAWAYVQSGFQLTPLLAINVGVAAPVILRGMTALPSHRSIDPGPGA